MPVVSRYFTLTAFKNRRGLTSTDATRDAYLKEHLEEASRQIDAMTIRWFYPLVDTREFTADSGGRCRVTDLLSVTSLKTDSDGDRTYEDTWSATDYDLMPYNYTPYQWIETTPQGLYVFPLSRKGVQIAGVWGYANDTTTSSTTLAEALDSSETGVDVVSGAAHEVGQTIRIESEDMLIESISSNTLTVTRGINGTTAAAHDTGIAISIRAFPPAIREATYLKAVQLFNATHGVGGKGGGNAQTGQAQSPSDKRIEELIAPFKRMV